MNRRPYRNPVWLLLCSVLLALARPVTAAAGTLRIESQETGIGAAVSEDGAYEIWSKRPAFRFSGVVGARLTSMSAQSAKDHVGNYQELTFRYITSFAQARVGAIRVYQRRPVVVFKCTFAERGTNRELFPILSSYPNTRFHLSYNSNAPFGSFSFRELGPDGPWVFFDEEFNSFVVSPAANYMIAELGLGPSGEIHSGITGEIAHLPAKFTQLTALVIGSGINNTMQSWGRFLTELGGKARPPNTAGRFMKYLGYWTDNGAHYYYRFEPRLGYQGSLLRVRDEFKNHGIALGYLEIDSWFYPKGRHASWLGDTDNQRGGVYRYVASRRLFPAGLGNFRRRLGLALLAHNRWIDTRSPYRHRYRLSGNVAIDPSLWRKWMHYLRLSGVRGYEQDWLSGPAVPKRDIDSGERFMDQMAQAASRAGIWLQYCMPLPRHFLQGTRYANLLAIRTSGDRFGRDKWQAFLFNGRLASALGEWPWTDVFMSSETSNLLLANLSASLVGVGDAIGSFDWDNLRHVVRSDGVIVKPDDTLTPIDASYLEAAKGGHKPLVAAAHTSHAGIVSSYVFAFGQSSGEQQMRVPLAALGYGQTGIYAYNYFANTGSYLGPGQVLSAPVNSQGSFWIVVPVGASGIGFMGDPRKFVGTGKARIAELRDDGTLRATISLARNEHKIELLGFALGVPEIHAERAAIGKLSYDRQTGVFRVEVTAQSGAAPIVMMRAIPQPHQDLRRPASDETPAIGR